MLGETVNLAARLHGCGGCPARSWSRRARTPCSADASCARTSERTGSRASASPFRVWRVVRPRSIASHFTAAGDDRRAPLVGREDDLTWLLGLWRSAADHRGRVATLAGEAGIGKSRVAEAAARVPGRRLHAAALPVLAALHEPRAASGDRTHRARPPGSAPKIRQRRSSTSSRPGWSPETDRRRGPGAPGGAAVDSGGCGPAAPGDERPAAETGHLRPPAPYRGRRRRSLRPLLILFEDLHWADPTTLEFLSALVLRIDGMAALAICHLPPRFRRAVEGAARWRAASCGAYRARRRSSLVEHVAGAGRMPDAVLEQVVLRADGIPLFIEELTHAVLGSGRTGRRPSRHRGCAGARAGRRHTRHPAGLADGAARSARSGEVRGAAGQRHRA